MKNYYKMDRTKRDIILAWDDADEVREDLALTDEEIVQCLPSMRERMRRVCDLLQDKFSVDEYNELFVVDGYTRNQQKAVKKNGQDKNSAKKAKRKG